uniref:Uncharacterized protein n=1 Tax=Fagus sylvatica TaxID=28930 RepID=A0A2N9FQ51_FAGSY
MANAKSAKELIVTANTVTVVPVATSTFTSDKTDWEELKDEESTESKATLEIEDTKLGEFADSSAYKVKKTNVGKDGTEIATEIEHFSHKHDLKLSDDEVQNNEICDGCVRAILPPFYSVDAMASSIVVRHAMVVNLMLKCSLISDILTHPDDSGEYYCAISVKKNETQSIGSTTVKIAVILLIPNVFLGNTQIASLEVLTHLTCHPHPLTFIEETKDHPLCDTNVAVLAKS